MQRLLFAFYAIVSTFGSSAAIANAVREDDLRPHIQILASDAFEGREPGTAGEQKTLDYLKKAWSKAGLKPGGENGDWLEPVKLVRRGPKQHAATFFVKGEKIRFASDEMILVGREANYQARKLPLVFVGHGVDKDGKAPADVSGKAVFMLADPADFLPDNMRSGRARREALIAAGAEAVISIAGEQLDYPVFRRLLMTRPISLESRERRAQIEGAVSAKFMVALVTAGGGDWDKLRIAAKMQDFGARLLGVTADFDVQTDVNRFDSYNFVGKLPGRKPESGAVLFMGHWDHLGICRPEGDKDRICNGAVDNASGIAVLTEVARQMSRGKYDRDVYFLATTAEESGLLGAQSFVDNPFVPLDKIVIALNIDTIAVAKRGAKVSIIGRGTTSLEPLIENIARKAKRKIESSNDANSFLQRQDGWILTQKGVPALMVGGAFADMDLLERFLGSLYHGPDDEYDKANELAGAAEDATLHILLGQYFANAKKYVGSPPAKKAGE
jgi:hypothetical protein